MDKEECEKIHRILDDIHSKFLQDYYEYKNGKNKKIRDAAESKLANAIHLADFHIRNNVEVYYLLTGEDNNDYGRTIIYDEFLQFRYFGNDMRNLLTKMKKKIQSFDDV
jgi:hypothetical protein